MAAAAGGDQAKPAAEARTKPASAQQIDKLIRQLGDKDYYVRQRAQDELARLGFEAFDALECRHDRRGPGDRVPGEVPAAPDAGGVDAAERSAGSQEVPAGLRVPGRRRAGAGHAGAGRIARRRGRRRLVPAGAVREVAAVVEDGGLGPAFSPSRRRAAQSRRDRNRPQELAGLQAARRRLVVGLVAAGRRARGRDVASGPSWSTTSRQLLRRTPSGDQSRDRRRLDPLSSGLVEETRQRPRRP